MAKELRRGRVMPCTVCNTKGATVGCSAPSCSANVHLTCAVTAEQWRLPVPWLKEGNPFLCHKHAQVGHGDLYQKKTRPRFCLGLFFF